MNPDCTRGGETTFEQICETLGKVLADSGLIANELSPERSLIELGFDSLKLAELVVALEDDLGIVEFPMQAWIDEEGERSEPRYTVRSFFEKCLIVSGASTGKN